MCVKANVILSQKMKKSDTRGREDLSVRKRSLDIEMFRKDKSFVEIFLMVFKR